jgi:hypothetical protein
MRRRDSLFITDEIESRSVQPVRVAVRSRRRFSTAAPAAPTSTLESLTAQREYLITRINEIDAKRAEIKAKMRACHGQSKKGLTIAMLRDEDQKLLEDRNDTCRQAADAKRLIKTIVNEKRQQQDMEARLFMKAAQAMLEPEQYEAILAKVQSVSNSNH